MTSIKPAYPNRFAYTHPITVRYADLDPQQHVNNAAVVTYLESARMIYMPMCHHNAAPYPNQIMQAFWHFMRYPFVQEFRYHLGFLHSHFLS